MSTAPLVVLCADDSETDAMLLEYQLEQVDGLRFEFHHAPSGEATLAWLEGQRADVLFLDNDLGDYTALELLGRLQGLGGETWVVLLTGLLDERMQPRLRELGCSAWLDKNRLDSDALVACLAPLRGPP